jgi:hypothetical protein
MWKASTINEKSYKRIIISFERGMCYCSWSSHYATSWKVVGSISDEVIGFFN